MATAADAWMKEKFTLGLKLPNLPHYIDGDLKITQSNAIMRHFGRKHDLLGNTEEEKIKCDMALDFAVDLQNDNTKAILQADFDEVKANFGSSYDGKMKVLDEFLEDSLFLAGDNISIADFRMYEILDMHKYFIPTKGILDKYPRLCAYVERFEALPKIKEYRKSDKCDPKFLSGPFFQDKFDVYM